MSSDHAVLLVPSLATPPALALALAATLSFVGGSIRWNVFVNPANLPAQLGGWAGFVLSVGALLFVANQADERKLRVLVWVFLAVAGLFMIGRVFQPLGGKLILSLYQSGSDGSMFWVWTAALAAGQLIYNRTLSRRQHLVLGVLVAATVYSCWFQSRSWSSGWLPVFTVLGVLLWLRSPRWGFLITALCLLAIALRYSDLPASILASEQYSTETRLIAWRIVLFDVTPQNALLGLGPANYSNYTVLYPILGWYVRFNSHNQYIDVLAQVGVLGLACLAWLFVTLGLLAWRLRNRFRADFNEGFVYACLAGLAGTLAAGMLADWLIPYVYNVGFAGLRASIFAWLFLGGLIVLEQVSRRTTALEAGESGGSFEARSDG